MSAMPALVLRLLLLSALFSIEPAQAAEVVVHASRHDGVPYVDASAEVEADLVQSWRLLTDYDHLSAFIPGMRVSRVLAREGNRIVFAADGACRQGRGLYVAPPREPPVIQSLDEASRQCAEIPQVVDAGMEQSGVVDGMAARVSGFPHLRVNRVLASYAREALDGDLLERYFGMASP